MKTKTTKNGNIKITLSPVDATMLASIVGELPQSIFPGVYESLKAVLPPELSRLAGRSLDLQRGLRESVGDLQARALAVEL